LPTGISSKKTSVSRAATCFSPDTILLNFGEYVLTTDPRLVHRDAVSYKDHTSGAGIMLAANGALVPNLVLWSQTVAVQPGSSYDFSIWVSTWAAGSPARLDFLFNDDDK
jgi:hypothetical protein